MFALIGAVIGLATSAAAAKKSSKNASLSALATMKQMKEAAAADTQARKAEANSIIARVEADDFKLQQLDFNKRIIQLQGKADSLLRLQNYNDVMEKAVIMGAASGRMLGQGSVKAIYDKSEEEYNWEQLWNANNLIISNAALEVDKTNILKAGATSLLLGAQGLEVSRLRSQAGQTTISDAAERAIRTSELQNQVNIGNAIGNVFKAYGSRPDNLFNTGG